jgi:hypothetical protein
VAIVFDMGPLLAARSPLLVRKCSTLPLVRSQRGWMEEKLQQFAKLLRACGPVRT